MKICIFCISSFTYEKFLKPLALELSNRGHQVTVVLGDTNFTDDNQEGKIEFYELDVARSKRINSLFRQLYPVFKFFNRHEFDVVNVHTPLASYLLRLSSFLSKKPKIIYTVHGFYFHQGQSILKKVIHKSIEIILSYRTAGFIFVSIEDQTTFIKGFRTQNKKRYAHIPNTLLKNKFDFDLNMRNKIRQRFNFSNEHVVIGMVCRFTAEKGLIEYLNCAIQIVDEFDHVRFLLIGDFMDGEESVEFRHVVSEKLKQLGQKIVLTGMVRSVADYLNGMDIFCLPSHREGYPYSLMEALTNGCECVASDIRGCREIASKVENCALIPAKNEEALLSCLMEKANSFNHNDADRKSNSISNSKVFSSANCYSDQADFIESFDDEKNSIL